MNAPCRNCPGRIPGCHDDCKWYQEYLAWAREKNRKARDCTRSDAFYDEMTVKFHKSEWWK